ncbi:MAG TPA: M50 family metallopeptidase [Candidatus Limnocylindria bacterium]|nr:M50 family metallopeptidase [Candidatus Limnocylindria bacterium]
MDVITTVAAFLAILVVLVLVHEIGHFIAAKLAGITVEEFGVGFPPRAASVMFRGTRYSLNWIPLGGFVRMLGEDGDVEIRRLRENGLADEEIERAMQGAFNRKPIWIRIAVLVAGVLMNFLLAVVLFAGLAAMPQPYSAGPLEVLSVQEDSPAEGVLEVGDVIVAADGRTFERSRDLTAYITEKAGEPVTLTIVRDGQEMQVTVTPRELTQEEIEAGRGPIGFGWRSQRIGEDPPLATGPVDALRWGVVTTVEVAVQIPAGLARAVGGLLGLSPEGAGDARGPIGIAQITGEVIDSGILAVMQFVALLSVNLAVLNVLPFPPLDGGRVAVVLLEAARRRRLPAEREAFIYLAGFAVLIALVILISIQDIQRIISGG